MTVDDVDDLARFCGLPFHAISEFTPERLVLHEILIRVMAELTIDDGPLQSDLGANFRKIVTSLWDRHFAAEIACITEAFQKLRREIADRIRDEVAPFEQAKCPSRSPAPERNSNWLMRFFMRPNPAHETADATDPRDDALDLLERWRRRSQGDVGFPTLDQSLNGALFKAGSAILNRQGDLMGRHAPLGRLAVALTCNDYGARFIGGLVEPIFDSAVNAEGFRRLPPQTHPVVMNTKGASAAGKSTLRPKQRELARRIGVAWEDFALISPDIWRKQLLDYGTLGADYRWAGTLTGHEVEIIDRKLDAHVARRAAMGVRTHLLIDRFRFDSFAPEDAEDDATQLLTRFGSEVYMFFMITPPEATVERAWLRGERVGRYKAVDDLLAHNVEAYAGMPGLFFRWLASPDKRVHYEFLDNSVEEGETPRTIAFGRNQDINIVDVDGLTNIDRFRMINIAAKAASEVYADALQKSGEGLEFLANCIRQAPCVRLADHATGAIYMVFRDGKAVDLRADLMQASVGSAQVRAWLAEHAAAGGLDGIGDRGGPGYIDADQYRTLGAWGGRRA